MAVSSDAEKHGKCRGRRGKSSRKVPPHIVSRSRDTCGRGKTEKRRKKAEMKNVAFQRRRAKKKRLARSMLHDGVYGLEWGTADAPQAQRPFARRSATGAGRAVTAEVKVPQAAPGSLTTCWPGPTMRRSEEPGAPGPGALRGLGKAFSRGDGAPPAAGGGTTPAGDVPGRDSWTLT